MIAARITRCASARKLEDGRSSRSVHNVTPRYYITRDAFKASDLTRRVRKLTRAAFSVGGTGGPG